jgi:hypothetical protein
VGVKESSLLGERPVLLRLVLQGGPPDRKRRVLLLLVLILSTPGSYE